MSRYVRFRRGAVAIPAKEQLDRVLRDSAAVADYDASLGVTGALNASAWANQIGAAGPLLQATGANQPIVLPYTGEKYAYFSGVAGNNLTTPDSVANSITGDIDIRVKVGMDDWTPAAAKSFISKLQASGQYSWQFTVVSGGDTGKLSLWQSSDGTALASNLSSVATGFVDGTTHWVRATRVASSGVITYYTSEDGATWTQLGTTVAGAAGNIFDGTSKVEIGSNLNGSGNLAPSKYYRAQIYNGINGTLAVDFNAADWSETSTNGATATSSTTGEVWTLNNTGAKPAMIVASASLLADGTAHKLATANFTLNQPVYGWIVAKQITHTAGDWLLSGTAGAGGIIVSATSPNISANAGSSAAANTGATLNAYHVIEYLLSGADSYISVNGGTRTTGDAGAGNPGGLSLFSDNAGANYGNWQIKRWIVRSGAQAQIQALLKSIYGTP